MSETQKQKDLLENLPSNVLFDLARNESADPSWRKAATKFLLKKDPKRAEHIELKWLVHEIEKEEQAEKDVLAVVESAIEQELFPEEGYPHE